MSRGVRRWGDLTIQRIPYTASGTGGSENWTVYNYFTWVCICYSQSVKPVITKVIQDLLLTLVYRLLVNLCNIWSWFSVISWNAWDFQSFHVLPGGHRNFAKWLICLGITRNDWFHRLTVTYTPCIWRNNVYALELKLESHCQTDWPHNNFCLR